MVTSQWLVKVSLTLHLGHRKKIPQGDLSGQWCAHIKCWYRPPDAITVDRSGEKWKKKRQRKKKDRKRRKEKGNVEKVKKGKKSFCISMIFNIKTQQHILLYFRGRILNPAFHPQILLKELIGWKLWCTSSHILRSQWQAEADRQCQP